MNDPETEHMILDGVPATTEGLEALLNLHGRQGYRYSGMIYDKIVMIREKKAE